MVDAPEDVAPKVANRLAAWLAPFRERRALVTAEEARKSVAVCLAVEEALREGR